MSTDASVEAHESKAGHGGWRRRVRPFRSFLALSTALAVIAAASTVAVTASTVIGAQPAMAAGPLINGGGSSYAAVAIANGSTT